MSQYVNGQRWISLAEPELGLGVVSECEHRRVTIEFPHAETNRLYSIGTTPLIRCKFTIGDKIELLNGSIESIVSLQERAGVLYYELSSESWISEDKLAHDQGNLEQGLLLAAYGCHNKQEV